MLVLFSVGSVGKIKHKNDVIGISLLRLFYVSAGQSETAVSQSNHDYLTFATAELPGFFTVMTPLHMHWHVQLSSSAGDPSTFIIALPGAQGAVTAGTQGIGVSVPMAADVACATWGLFIVWHSPKGSMLVFGTLSSIVAMSILPHFGRIGTLTVSDDGVVPKVHWSIAPVVTSFPI